MPALGAPGSVELTTDGAMNCVSEIFSQPLEVTVPFTAAPCVLVPTTLYDVLGPERTLATGTLTHRVTLLCSTVGRMRAGAAGIVGVAGTRPWGRRGTWGDGAAEAVGASATTGAVAAVTAISVRDRLRVRDDIEPAI
ncbi:hypothetical protein GCM10011509_02170 [Ornithinimicrobium pekingense]|uniref:Uncharacterized protein n=1 Tax=Ornithinimicrobium pekingense TaxID=384677 RepID=A0ABQ2F449_9MICO|nr:hypothetical protein GCM10011509_02170 [Ornithinimicrobium pekingense]